MKNKMIWASGLLFLFLLLPSCSSDEDGGGNPDGSYAVADIQGSWDATVFAFDIAGTGPSMRVDIIGEGGTATMTIQSDGRFTIVFTEPGGSPGTLTGDLYFDKDLLVLAFDGETGEEYYGFSLSGDGNTMMIEGPAEYDLDNDGTDDPAIVEITWVRS